MGPSPLLIVRAITTAITCFVWWLLLYGAGWVFAGGGKVDHVSPLAMANLAAVSYLFVPYFTTEGVLMSMLGAHMKQRIQMPEVKEDPSARPLNPWFWSLVNVAVFGILAAVLGYMVSMRAAPDSVTPHVFAVRYAWGGTALCAIVAWFVSGMPFLKQVRVPRANRAYQGGKNRYLWTRYVLPHGVANMIINGALAFALAPVALQGPAIVKAEVVVGDAVITLFVLTWLISAGVKTMARTETEWRIAKHDFAADLHMPAAFLPTFFIGFGACIALGILFAWFDVEEMSVTAWVVLRGVAFGVYCGWCAKRCAQAAINEAFHPEVIVYTRPPRTRPEAVPMDTPSAPLPATQPGAR